MATVVLEPQVQVFLPGGMLIILSAIPATNKETKDFLALFAIVLTGRMRIVKWCNVPCATSKKLQYSTENTN